MENLLDTIPFSSTNEKKEKNHNDSDKPKKPTTSFLLWLNENRENIKKENEGIKGKDIVKKGGKMWRELEDKSEWEAKSKENRERYNRQMAKYEASRIEDEEKEKIGKLIKKKADSTTVQIIGHNIKADKPENKPKSNGKKKLPKKLLEQ